MARVKVGQTVNWKGGFGTEPVKEAKITVMTLCAKGQKFGREVKSADWDTVLGKNKMQIIVELENGHWAYGNQLSPIQK